jgi:subtilisin family serine protease
MQKLNGMAGALGRARRVSLASLVALVTVVAASPPEAQAQVDAGRFKRLGGSGPIAAHRQPLSLSTKPVQVAVVLEGESVAEARAAAPGHLISQADHDAIHARLSRQHAAVGASVAARGGKVLADFSDALNALKVEIAAKDVAALRDIAGVVKVVPVPTYKLSNVVSVPFIGAPQVWQGTPGFRGEHIKIAMIDTGIDYTHANFGGPGTAAAFQTAAANSTQKADPTLFGPKAPKVKGGYDFAGDAYDASTTGSVPMPDPNPLDCNGHGSHTAGTAAGFGVANDGSTYHGPYDTAAYQKGFIIGPGVAPLADLYALRVFGCAGSSNLVTEAIDWSVHNHMDVISMSLGSDYGGAENSDSVASNNATRAGIVVVAAAGNSGPNPYLTSAPASTTQEISVAAMDANPFLVDGVIVKLASGLSVSGIDENALPLPKGSVPVLILTSGGTLSLGCDASDYPPGGAAGALVVVSRGTCTFDTKSYNAMAAGASALVLVNNAPGFINPLLDNVTIPFIELMQSAGASLAAQNSPTTGTVAFGNVPNTGYELAASFSSAGPRYGDGALKPNISAPGVAVVSTLIGSGNQGTSDSGTSMATPHVAGVAALAIQSHPNWQQPDVRAAIEQTATPSLLNDYAPRIEGSGVVQAVGATKTDVTASEAPFADFGSEPTDLGLLSFGVAELTSDYHQSRDIILTNHARFTDAFAASVTPVGGVPHTLKLSSSAVSIRGESQTGLHVSLSVPGTSVGQTHDAQGNDRLAEVAGYIRLTPEAGSNHGVGLTLPYYLVPRARSSVFADLNGGKNPNIKLTNRNGLVAGNGDFYAWGLFNEQSGDIEAMFEPRAIGVQTNPISATDSILVFAVNTYGRFSTAATGEYNIAIDVNGDGIPDFLLFSADVGGVETGFNNGQTGTFLVNLATGDEFAEFNADAPTDGSTVLMPVLASDLGITPSNPRFTYTVFAFDDTGTGEQVPGTASFNAFQPAVSNAMFVPVAPNKSATVPVAIDPLEIKVTPPLGFMVVTTDNLSGAPQANLLKLPHR